MTERVLNLLQKAQHEAAKASWLFTAPNPRVGALALKDGHIIGFGCHHGWGQAHAEEAALIDAGAMCPKTGELTSGIVDEMIVSLEPCCSAGGVKKRRPCTDLIIAAGVEKLTIGAADPDPRHCRLGARHWREAGVTLTEIDATAAFEELNQAFFEYQKISDRPWILHKWAASVDGKTANNTGDSKWISGEQSRTEVHQLRASCDAVLCGANTFLEDDPRLNARINTLDSIKQPLRVFILSKPLRDRHAAFEVAGNCLWVLPSEELKNDVLLKRLDLKDSHLVLPAENGKLVDLELLCQHLFRDFSVRRLLVEGGSRLQGAMLSQGLADAIVRYEAPLLLGGSRSACETEFSPAPAESIKLNYEERKQLGHDLRRAFQIEK